MIIIGYQGIGKTTVARNSWSCIDLESSSMRVNGQRQDNWYEVYCNIAEELSHQGYNVFVSAHKEVRDRLKNSKEEVRICYPIIELRESWIERLEKRYRRTNLKKDFYALSRAESHYTEDIYDMMNNGIKAIEIKDMNYDLSNLVNNERI